MTPFESSFPPRDAGALVHRFVEPAGARLHVVEAGDPAAPPVLLLHGFPEFWGVWSPYFSGLDEAGYRSVAPDLRGYGASARPARTSDYAIERLVADVEGLLTSCSPPVRVIAHDFGAELLWHVLLRRPELVRAALFINEPNPYHHDDARRTLREALASWHMSVLRFPALSTRLFSSGGWWLARQALRDNGFIAAVGERGFEELLDTWNEPGAARAMMNWYPGRFRWPLERPRDLTVNTPLRIVWGLDDRIVSRSVGEATMADCPRGRFVPVEGATHWLNLERPELVLEHALELFSEIP